MVNGKKKQNSKVVSQQKRHRRQWITFVRMCRYGVSNFTRNAWLTIAATAVMTITLFVIFVGVVAQHVLHGTVDQVRDKVSMSVYLKTDTTPEQADEVVGELKKLESVEAVRVESPADARANFIEQRKDDPDALDAVKEATNKFPWTLNIKVVDINDTSQLQTFVESNEVARPYLDPNRDASFAGDRREVIENIARTAAFIQQISIIVGAVLVAVSMLIIFNTIRMAIFNRREEIQMMKLIGAERSFIRGPFLVESIVYGFFAALLASGIGYVILTFATPWLVSVGTSIEPTVELLQIYAGFVLLAMIIVGAIIGVISSLLATRRYLKI